MRPLLGALFAVFLTSIFGPSSLVAADEAGGIGRVEWVDVPAPSLEGNLLGTPTVQRTAIYLPPSYDIDPGRRYPVVYLLHGIFDTPDVWVDHFGLPGIVGGLVAGGRIPEMIVVMPTGSNVTGGAFYRSSSVAGDWGSFVRDDLVTSVDSRYRTVAERGARAIVGHSMGGFGAIWHAMTSAEVFSVAYAMSPAVLGVEDDVSHGNATAWTGMLDLGGVEGIPRALEAREFWPVAAWSVCTTFLPDPTDPELLCDPPYRRERGELIPNEAELDRWRWQLPLSAADEHVAALRSMTGIALDYGLDDQFAHIPETTQSMSEVLAGLRVAHDLFVYRGDHRKEVSRRLEEVVFPWVARHLE